MYIGRRLGRIIELKCKIQTTPSNIGLCLPHPLDGLCDTNIVCLELVQTDGGGNSESTQQPVQERLGLGDAALGEVVDDRGMETNVGVEDQQGTEDGIHDRVQGAGSEGSDGQRDQSDRDESLECPVVATL